MKKITPQVLFFRGMDNVKFVLLPFIKTGI